MSHTKWISGPVSICQLKVHADGSSIEYEIFGDVHNSVDNYCPECTGSVCPVDIVAYINQEITNAEQTEDAPFLHILYEGSDAGCTMSSDPYPLDRVATMFCGKKGANYHVHDIDIRKEGILGALEENTTMSSFMGELARMNHSWTQTLSVFLECNLHATDYQQCFHDRLPTTHFEDETINQDVISPGGPSRIRHYTQLLNSATQRCIRTHWRNDISQRYLLNGLYLTSCMDNDTETTFEQRECFLNPDKTSFDNFMMILGSVLMEWYTIILSLSTINTDGNPIKQSDRPRAKKVIIYVGEAHQFHIVEFLKRLYPDNTTMTITQDSSSEYYRRYHEHNRNRCTSKISIPLPY